MSDEPTPTSLSKYRERLRTACYPCGAPIEWIEHDRAHREGFVLAEAADSLGLVSTEALDVWVCTDLR